MITRAPALTFLCAILCAPFSLKATAEEPPPPASAFSSWGTAVSGVRASLSGPSIVTNASDLSGLFYVALRSSTRLAFCVGQFDVNEVLVDRMGVKVKHSEPRRTTDIFSPLTAPEPLVPNSIYVLHPSIAISGPFSLRTFHHPPLEPGEYELSATVMTPRLSDGHGGRVSGITLSTQPLSITIQ